MSDTIKVKLPDGSQQEVPKGTTALDVAKTISPRLAQSALVARVPPLYGASSLGAGAKATATATAPQEGQLVDLTKPLEQDVELRILTEKDPEALHVFRHSSA